VKPKDFKRLQKEWYQRLKDEGFHDIEGGMEGHLLQQRTPTLQLGAAMAEMQGKMRGKYFSTSAEAKTREDPKAYEKWLDQAVSNYYDKGKTEYYSKAQELATMVFHIRHASVPLKCAWSMYSDGYGEEAIAAEMQLGRSKIRRYLYAMKDKLKEMIDSGDGPC
jgi:hypothetical protein